MSIFRAYDIRGIYGKDLTDQVASDIARALVTYDRCEEAVVGMDCRLSSPPLRGACVEGLKEMGADVLDAGIVPTPVFYFAINHWGERSGLMITASHNPPEWNGMKVCCKGEALYGEKIQELKRIVEARSFKPVKQEAGKLRNIEALAAYKEFVLSNFELERGLRVVVDGGNGVAGELGAELLEELGCDVKRLYCEPDGRFPNHQPDPSIDENLSDLSSEVLRRKASLGIAYDGDGDRVVFVTERGRVVRGDEALLIFAKRMLERKRGVKVVFEVKCSRATSECLEAWGGVPIMCRTGHSYIKKTMKETGALLAGEMSGHFFFGEGYYGYDDAIYASLKMVEILAETGKPLEALLGELPAYVSTPELRVSCDPEEGTRIIAHLKQKFAGRAERLVEIDGLRAEFEEGWFLARLSNTEAAMVFRFEARSKEELLKLEDSLLRELKPFNRLREDLLRLLR